MLLETQSNPVDTLLESAGVIPNGPNPWDMQVHDPKMYHRILAHGSLGLGESYMEGLWDCQQLDEFFHKILLAKLDEQFGRHHLIFNLLKSRLLNAQSPSRAFQVGKHHYDIGNDVYRGMLDPRMIYSCGYWKNANNLTEAQEAKLDLVCRKLQLEPGMRVLDIGCGWGGTAKFVAEHYHASVVGLTVSRQQANLAAETCIGLPVEIRLQDYRQLEGTFDRILSIGMFEHVGYKNFHNYFQIAQQHLHNDGLFLLHTIGNNKTVTNIDPWIERYIFPNSMIPSAKQITDACEEHFVIEDWHSFGHDYDTTLMRWYDNFIHHWPQIQNTYNERFYRMWVYYLLSSAGVFRARKLQLWQIVLSPEGVAGGKSVV